MSFLFLRKSFHCIHPCFQSYWCLKGIKPLYIAPWKKKTIIVALEKTADYLILVCKQVGIKVPSTLCEAPGPGSPFLGERDVGRVLISPEQAGSGLDEGRACSRVERGEQSRKKTHMDWPMVSALGPFPRTSRVAITHQQDSKENTHVIFHPSNSWAWRPHSSFQTHQALKL